MKCNEFKKRSIHEHDTFFNLFFQCKLFNSCPFCSRNFMLLIDAIISVVIDKKSNAKLLICKTHLAIQKFSLRFDKL